MLSPASTGCSVSFRKKSRTASDDKLPNVPEWDEHMRLAAEKEILGFFITGHPLEKYQEKLEDLNALSTIDIAAMTSVDRQRRNDHHRRRDYQRASAEIEEGRSLRPGCTGRHVGLSRYDRVSRGLQALAKSETRCSGAGARRCKSRRRREPQDEVNDIMPLEDAKVPSCRAPFVSGFRWRPLRSNGRRPARDLHERKGEAKVLFDVERQGDFMVVMEAEGYNVLPDRTFIARVEATYADGAQYVLSISGHIARIFPDLEASQ